MQLTPVYPKPGTGPGSPRLEALRVQTQTHVAPGLRAAGGEVLGLFFPQLGFASNEAVLVVRWTRRAAAGAWSKSIASSSVCVTD